MLPVLLFWFVAFVLSDVLLAWDHVYEYKFTFSFPSFFAGIIYYNKFLMTTPNRLKILILALLTNIVHQQHI